MGIWSTQADGGGNATIGIGSRSTIPSPLMKLLEAEAIQPGSEPSYQICKDLYAYHPLGNKMATASLDLAQSQKRELSVDSPVGDQLIQAFWREWKRIGRVGADAIIHNCMKQSRIYGIASLVVGERGIDPAHPLDMDNLHKADLYFTVLDPLNTAGSLVLNQNPNDPDYQKPEAIRAGGQVYHPNRTVVMMNEQPLYIQWSNSAFGFVGRSVYQRALYPLKSFVQTMITDDWISWKAGLLVTKFEAPGSTLDQRVRNFFAFKREQVQSAGTANVLSIGTTDSIESLDLKNIKDALEFARTNIIKNIATGADMPALLLNQETLASGFADGTEDAKQIVRHIDKVRAEMQPLYGIMDNIVQHRAWSPDFYEALKASHPAAIGSASYEACFYDWQEAFESEWPNLLVEPDSLAVEREAKILESCMAIFDTLSPKMDQENLADAAVWLADVANARKMMKSNPLLIDRDAMAAYTPPTTIAGAEPNF